MITKDQREDAYRFILDLSNRNNETKEFVRAVLTSITAKKNAVAKKQAQERGDEFRPVEYSDVVNQLLHGPVRLNDEVNNSYQTFMNQGAYPDADIWNRKPNLATPMGLRVLRYRKTVLRMLEVMLDVELDELPET